LQWPSIAHNIAGGEFPDAGRKMPGAMTSTAHAVGDALRASRVRAPGFLALWLILSGFESRDLVIGVPVAILATWTSLRLLPSRPGRLHPLALTALVFRFLYQSVVAGIDVARRALDPRLPLRTGFVTYRTRLPPGPARNAFAALTSLLPGTVPVGDENGCLLYHCLDTEQPVESQLQAEEAALSRVIHD